MLKIIPIVFLIVMMLYGLMAVVWPEKLRDWKYRRSHIAFVKRMMMKPGYLLACRIAGAGFAIGSSIMLFLVLAGRRPPQ
jgi:hypothetical protein